MATCSESITAALVSGIGTVPVIFPNTITPFEVTGLTNQLFRIEAPFPQTVTFSSSITSSPPNVIFTLYRIDGLSFTPIGSANIVNVTAGFSFDVLAGTYIICLRRGAFVNQTGSFVAEFVGFPVFQNFKPDVKVGETFDFVLTIPRVPVECNEALFFELVEGALPPGLQMDSLGTIYGELPILDCLDDAPSPSVGWYHKDDGATHPWGREWRFKVRLTTQGATAAPVEDWFCVRIHNNWDFDRDNFLANMPFESIAEIRVVDPVPKLDSICAPCKSVDVNENLFKPTPLTKESCPTCTDPNQKVRVDLIELPIDLCEIASDQIIEWYIQNKDRLFDSPEVAAFIAKLKESFAFRILLSKAGYSIEENESEFAIVNTYENFLQISIIQPTDTSEADPESWAGMVDQWRLIQNQSLPSTFVPRTGEEMSIELTKFDKLPTVP